MGQQLGCCSESDRGSGKVIVEEPLEEKGEDVQQYSEIHEQLLAEDATIALHMAAGRGDVEELRRLLELGTVPADAVDYDQRSALHYASTIGGHPQVTSLLLEKSAHVNLVDRWGNTPLDRAIEGEHKEAQELLIAAGASSGEELCALSPTTPMTAMGSMASMGSLMSGRGSIDPVVEGAVSLCCAAAAATALLKELVQGGVGVNSQDYDGRTALHVASAHGHLEVVKELVGMKADLNRRDKNGLTALRDATKHQHTSVVEYLRKKGAKTSNKGEMKLVAETGSWAISISEVELGERISKNHKSVIYRGTWRGTQVACKTTNRLRPSRIGEVFMSSDNSGGSDRVAPRPSIVSSMNSCTAEEQAAAEDELMQEIRMLSRMRHPDLVLFLGACMDYAPPMLLIEWMDGGDLEAYYKKQAKRRGQYYKPPRAQVFKWASAVARALAFLHNCQQPVIHRDLKPPNLLLTSTKELKVTDFGISKLLEPEVPGGDVAAVTSIPTYANGKGTRRYMAPEVIRHEKYTNSVDIYSLGLIMWFMCTGRQPFVEQFGPDDEGLFQAYIKGEEPRPDPKAMKCPTEFRDLTLECWHEDASSRPSAQDCA
eukprot:CAMPEP_0170276044 /NCGR_PEP_ID=MMETSP0116_2-20130129/38007_1 /TAXON_ID=400756 /ORGANISM="Durinskia baltica, Strain CSIRO CS-38" /LENGTH=598 /DNA_ID=CAMNT_0010527317 /DNA_START=60 /DNA_END=1854 /DNA_ORIENTATION=+